MKIRSVLFVILIVLNVLLHSCSTKQESTNQAGDLTDLKDFPKEWVLVADLSPPDSIKREYVVLVDSSNAFLGGITIKENDSIWQMINSGFYYPGTYDIKNCKRTTEAEMVYFDFDLQLTGDTTHLKLKVNFRHNPGEADDVPSVFTCTTCDSNQDVLLAEKSMIDRFPKKPLSAVQYD